MILATSLPGPPMMLVLLPTVPPSIRQVPAKMRGPPLKSPSPR